MIRKLALGAVIYFFREHRKKTRKELGEICGWTDKRIDKYERGEASPSIDSLEILAPKLGVTPNDLLAGRDGWLAYLARIGFGGLDEERYPEVPPSGEVQEGTGLLPGDLHEAWLDLLEDEERLRRRQGELARRRDSLEHKIWAELARR